MSMTLTQDELRELATGVGLNTYVVYGRIAIRDEHGYPEMRYVDWLLTPAGMVWLLEWNADNKFGYVMARIEGVHTCVMAGSETVVGEGDTPMLAVARAALAVVRSNKEVAKP